MAFRTKLTYDSRTGTVYVRLLARMGARRRMRSVAVLPIPRASIRTFCDTLHDFADGLDSRDRDGQRGEGAFGSQNAEAAPYSTGSRFSLPGEHPHRAGAREERARG